jgi:nitroreductase
MNNTIKELCDRKSVRAFTGQKITAEEKEAILKAAVNAPTAGNQQLYTIIDVTDQALKERLVKSCDDQPFIAAADLVLIFCADCKKWYDAYLSVNAEPRAPGVGDLFLAVSDTNIAAQNAVTAAESLGIGSCYIGDIMENCEQQRELLNLPEYVFPAAMLVFGYPTHQQKERQKPRRAEIEHIVHENSYRVMDANELRELFSMRADKKTYEDYMDAFCKRKYNSDFSVEMSRSVGEYIKQFEP